MGSQIQVKVTGLAELEARVRKAPDLVGSELETAIKKSLYSFQSEAMKEAPVKTGNLSRKIRTRFTGRFSGAVEPKAAYSAPVHDGSRPHIIRSHGNYPLRNKKTGQTFGRVVHHPGNKPNPFLIRAIHNATRTVEGYFNTAIENVVKAMAG